jgi:hypothetical protein
MEKQLNEMVNQLRQMKRQAGESSPSPSPKRDFQE